MNMRQHKRAVTARLHFNNFWLWFDRRPVTPLVQAFRDGMAQADVEEAKREFVCQKVKDGSVVDTFDTREDALALVQKHAKQRKAKLQVMDSLTGELVLFAEEEMA